MQPRGTIEPVYMGSDVYDRLQTLVNEISEYVGVLNHPLLIIHHQLSTIPFKQATISPAYGLGFNATAPLKVKSGRIVD